jgi:hypothetical protein
MADLPVALFGKLEVLLRIGRLELAPAAVAEEVAQRDLVEVARARPDDLAALWVAPAREEESVLAEGLGRDGGELDLVRWCRGRRAEPVDEPLDVRAVPFGGDGGAPVDFQLLEEVQQQRPEGLAAYAAPTREVVKATKCAIDLKLGNARSKVKPARPGTPL